MHTAETEENTAALADGDAAVKNFEEWKRERRKAEKAKKRRQKKSSSASLSSFVALGFFLMMLPLIGAMTYIHLYGWQWNHSKDDAGSEVELKLDGDVIEVDPDGFHTFLFNKNDSTSVFTLFYAPWCAHCKAFKPDWQIVGKAYSGSGHAKIAQYDCTASVGNCETMDIDSYPTLLYWRDPTQNQYPERYTGPKHVDALMEFVHYRLGPQCTNDQQQYCTNREKRILQKLLDMPESERAAKLTAAEQQIADVESKFRQQVDQMSQEYDELLEKTEVVRKKFTGIEWDLLKTIPNDEEEDNG